MLKSIFIKNYALLDEIQVTFNRGLNVITGETGAGKSIIIGALGMLLGEKADVETIRGGAEKAIIEGQFVVRESALVEAFLKDHDLYDNGDELLLRRELNSSGRSRSFVNDTPVAMSVLKALGDLLVDLHGQHEHQSLLREREHLHYLDAYGQLGDLAVQVRANYDQVKSDGETLRELRQKERELQEKRSLYEFQLREIESVQPKLGEEEDLEKEERLLNNSEKLFARTEEMYKRLYEDDGSVLETLHTATQTLGELSKIDSYFDSLREMCQSARITIDEVAKSLRDYTAQIEFSPQRLEEVRERLARISGLKKKYGGSIERVLQCAGDAGRELHLLDNLDREIANAEKVLGEHTEVLGALCQELSDERKRVAALLGDEIVGELVLLGMPHSVFEIRVRAREEVTGEVTIKNKRYAVTPTGIDEVSFYISTNQGEDVRQLAKVASGGEISRIMLALKAALAASDHIPVLIFDEIDLGISGRIAQVVGKNLKKLSATHQIICITHLPQIASMGEQHYHVTKITDANRTYTSVMKLSEEERPQQIAKLLGGEKISDTHIKSAQQLLDEARQ